MREAEKRTEGRRKVRVMLGPYEKGGELQESFQPNVAKDAKPGKRPLSCGSETGGSSFSSS